MRLTQNEVLLIIEAFNKNALPEQTQLRLFGSRANDNMRGGDIDLLLILPDKKDYQKVALKKVTTLVEIQKKLGEQKIDLIIATNEDLGTDPFLKLIFPSSVVLHTW